MADDFTEALLRRYAALGIDQTPEPPKSSFGLSDILNNTIGLQKRGEDYLGNVVANELIGPQEPGSQPYSLGKMAAEAAFGSPETGEGYGTALGRAGLETFTDIGTDPLTLETLGAGGVASSSARAAAELAGAGAAAEDVQKALGVSRSIEKAQRLLNPVFAGSMALGAAESVPEAIHGFREEGLNPQTAARGLKAGIEVGGLGLIGSHMWKGRNAPTMTPDTFLRDGLDQLVNQGRMNPQQADEVFAKYQNPELINQEAQATVQQQQGPTPIEDQFAATKANVQGYEGILPTEETAAPVEAPVPEAPPAPAPVAQPQAASNATAGLTEPNIDAGDALWTDEDIANFKAQGQAPEPVQPAVPVEAAQPEPIPESIAPPQAPIEAAPAPNLLDQAREFFKGRPEAPTTSILQRRFRIGFKQASEILDALQAESVPISEIPPPQGPTRTIEDQLQVRPVQPFGFEDLGALAPPEPAAVAEPQAAPVPVVEPVVEAPAPPPIDREAEAQKARADIGAIEEGEKKKILTKSEKYPYILSLIREKLAGLNPEFEPHPYDLPKIQELVDELKQRGQGVTHAHVGIVRKALADAGLLQDFGIKSAADLPKQGAREPARVARKAEANNKRAAKQQAQAEAEAKPLPQRFQEKYGEEFQETNPDHVAKMEDLAAEALGDKQTLRGAAKTSVEAKAAKEAPEPPVQEVAPPTVEEAPKEVQELVDIKSLSDEEAKAYSERLAANPEDLQTKADELAERVRGFDPDAKQFRGKAGQKKLAEAIVKEVRRPNFQLTKIEHTRLEEQNLAGIKEASALDAKLGVSGPETDTIEQQRQFKSQEEFEKALEDQKKLLKTYKANPQFLGLADVADRVRALATVGADYLRKGIRDTYEFGSRLIKDFGEWVRPHIREVYNKAHEIFKSFSFGPLENEPGGTNIGMLGGAAQGILNPRRLPKPKTAGENVRTAGNMSKERLAKLEKDLEEFQGPMEEKVKPYPRNAEESKGLLNIEKSSKDPEIRQLNARLVQVLDDVLNRAKGPKRSFEEEMKEARELGISTKEFTQIYKASNGTLNAKETVVAKMLMDHSAQEYLKWAGKVEKLKAEGKDTSLAELGRAAASEQMAGVRAAFVGAGAETARALGIRRALVDAMNEGDYVLARVKRIFKLSPEHEAMIKKALESGDEAALREALRKANNPTKLKAFMEWWKSWGLLSGPPTHVANWMGNRLMREVKYWDGGVAAGLDSLYSKVTGVDRKIFLREWSAMKFGAKEIKNMARTRLLKDVQDAFTGTAPAVRELLEGSKIDNPGVVGGRAGEYNRMWFKLLEGADAYHKAIAGAEELYRQSFRKARYSGLDDEAAWEAMKKHAADYIKEEDAITAGELPGHSEDYASMAQKVQWARTHYTFQDNLGKAGQAIQRGIQEHPLLGFIFPFVKTPVNIAKRTLEHTPGGALYTYMKWKSGAEHGGLDRVSATENYAKAVVGTTIATAVYALANEGLITGGGPADPKKMEAKKGTGWQPYSAKLGDTYVSLQRFEPLSSIVGMAADLSEAINSGDIKGGGETAQKLIGSIVENLTSKTFLSGLEALSTAIHDPKRYGERFLKQLEASLVPNIVGKAAQALDPTYRKTEITDLSPLQAKIPGLSQKLEAQKTPTGEERQRAGVLGGVERFISPAITQSENKPRAELYKEFTNVDFVPSLTRDYLSPYGKKTFLITAEKEIMNKAMEKASDAAERLIKDPTYKKLPDNDEDAPVGQRFTKKKALEQLYSKYRKQAQDQIMPDVMKRMMQEQRR